MMSFPSCFLAGYTFIGCKCMLNQSYFDQVNTSVAWLHYCQSVFFIFPVVANTPLYDCPCSVLLCKSRCVIGLHWLTPGWWDVATSVPETWRMVFGAASAPTHPNHQSRCCKLFKFKLCDCFVWSVLFVSNSFEKLLSWMLIIGLTCICNLGAGK